MEEVKNIDLFSNSGSASHDLCELGKFSNFSRPLFAYPEDGEDKMTYAIGLFGELCKLSYGKHLVRLV